MDDNQCSAHQITYKKSRHTQNDTTLLKVKRSRRIISEKVHRKNETFFHKSQMSGKPWTFGCSVFLFPNQVLYRFMKCESKWQLLADGVITSNAEIYHYEKAPGSQNDLRLVLHLNRKEFLTVLWTLQGKVIETLSEHIPKRSIMFLHAIPFMEVEHIRFFAKSFMEIFALNQFRFTIGSCAFRMKNPSYVCQITRVRYREEGQEEEKYAWVVEHIAAYLRVSKVVICQLVPDTTRRAVEENAKMEISFANDKVIVKIAGKSETITETWENSIFLIFGRPETGEALGNSLSSLAWSGKLVVIGAKQKTGESGSSTSISLVRLYTPPGANDDDCDPLFQFATNPNEAKLISGDLNFPAYLTYGPECAVWCFSTYRE